MLTEFSPEIHSAEPPGPQGPAGMFPPGATIQQLKFVPKADAGQQIVCELPPPIQQVAVLVHANLAGHGNHQPKAAACDLTLLSIPVAPGAAVNELDEGISTSMTHWVEAAFSGDDPQCQVMTFQNAQLCWAPGRVAILAAPERMEALRKAIIVAVYLEAELGDIEQGLGAAWPQLEADTAHAFEFDERSLKQRKQLRKRFQQMMLLRARLARIGPHVQSPFQHPPTLASQISERVRERMRMAHRYEFVSQQLEVFEHVYEMCGQRASDFVLTRSGNTLEWVIIVLLLTQILLAGFELLTTMGQ